MFGKPRSILGSVKCFLVLRGGLTKGCRSWFYPILRLIGARIGFMDLHGKLPPYTSGGNQLLTLQTKMLSVKSSLGQNENHCPKFFLFSKKWMLDHLLFFVVNIKLSSAVARSKRICFVEASHVFVCVVLAHN